MYFYLKDKLVPEEEAVVSVMDRGLLFGDGIFETLRVYNGKVFRLRDHLVRLQRSAQLLELSLPGPLDSIKSAIYETINKNKLKDAYIRVNITRGRGPMGLDHTFCREPTFFIIARDHVAVPDTYYSDGIKLIISSTVRMHAEALDPRIKSLNFLNNIQARSEAAKAEVFDSLMLNHAGYLAECSVSNIFFVTDGVLYTPAIESGILEGVTRNVVIESAEGMGIKVEQGFYSASDIHNADEVFITNTGSEILPVRMLDNAMYNVGEITTRLHKAYRELTANSNGA
jgi:branched-chain amino acid aminotransferase